MEPTTNQEGAIMNQYGSNEEINKEPTKSTRTQQESIRNPEGNHEYQKRIDDKSLRHQTTNQEGIKRETRRYQYKTNNKSIRNQQLIKKETITCQ